MLHVSRVTTPSSQVLFKHDACLAIYTTAPMTMWKLHISWRWHHYIITRRRRWRASLLSTCYTTEYRSSSSTIEKSLYMPAARPVFGPKKFFAYADDLFWRAVLSRLSSW